MLTRVFYRQPAPFMIDASRSAPVMMYPVMLLFVLLYSVGSTELEKHFCERAQMEDMPDVMLPFLGGVKTTDLYFANKTQGPQVRCE